MLLKHNLCEVYKMKKSIRKNLYEKIYMKKSKLYHVHGFCRIVAFKVNRA